ncbi:TlpA disulfide reductase family protein [Pedobacter gandavensis]|uniref:TlpA disulfide reductase family protein n=1 Tax=Pedobacter gandavensis TaxID=2679963 RepID=UPI0029302D27|nr:TlpA disulfide reductase family protein [Pedobacter gandavensis]
MLKKMILVMFIITFSIAGAFAQKKAIVEGKIAGLTSKTIFIFIENAKGYVRDSIAVKNGSFHYEKEVDAVCLATINMNMEQTTKRVGKGFLPNRSGSLQIFLSPGAHLNISGKVTDFVDAYPSGDEANEVLAKLNKVIYPLDNEYANLYVKQRTDKGGDSIAIASKIESLNKEIDTEKRKLVFGNPNSHAAIWLINDMMLRSELTDKEAVEIFPKISGTKFKSDHYYTQVMQRVGGIKETAIGQPVPEIIVDKAYDGKPFKLTALKGKYVVLDFWGTWCMPCISGMPKMKEYQDKYRDRLVIVGIAKESDDGTSWKKFLAGKPEFDWVHILNPKNINYVTKFNVAGFPTKIIISPDGKIVARFVGEDDAIYKKLDQLLGDN